MEILSAINSSIDTLKKIKELSESLKNTEMKQLVADLSNELADTKLAVAELKSEILALKEENAALKVNKEKQDKPEIKWGCYIFDGDDSRLYCTTCYDLKGIRVLTTRLTPISRRCNNCKSELTRQCVSSLITMR